jgi:type 1 glutamine amidotransferase
MGLGWILALVAFPTVPTDCNDAITRQRSFYLRRAVAALPKVPIVRQPARPHVVFVIGEDEYRTEVTLPQFAAKELEPRGVRCTMVLADPKKPNEFPSLEKIRQADVVVLSVRRRLLPEAQLALIRDYLNAGRPLVGIRTASHAFSLRDRPGGWPEFDRDVLGGDYRGHYGPGQEAMISIIPEQAAHPILQGVAGEFRSKAHLYKNARLAQSAEPLLLGRLSADGPEREFVAWTNRYKKARIFYTSLGSVDDFAEPSFRRLLLNAIFWAMQREVPKPN